MIRDLVKTKRIAISAFYIQSTILLKAAAPLSYIFISYTAAINKHRQCDGGTRNMAMKLYNKLNSLVWKFSHIAKPIGSFLSTLKKYVICASLYDVNMDGVNACIFGFELNFEKVNILFLGEKKKVTLRKISEKKTCDYREFLDIAEIFD